MAANPPQKHEAFYYYSSGRCWCNECIESGGRAKKERTKKKLKYKKSESQPRGGQGLARTRIFVTRLGRKKKRRRVRE